MSMRRFIPLPDLSHWGVRSVKLEVLKRLDIKESDISLNGKFVVYKDYVLKEMLISSIPGPEEKHSGRLYQQLLKLDLPIDKTKDLLDSEKQRIMDFVGKFAIPSDSYQNMIGLFRNKPDRSLSEGGDSISWLFIPYKSKPQEKSISYFDLFHDAYLNVLKIYKAIKSGDIDLLERYGGVFDTYLKGNNLRFFRDKNGPVRLKFTSQTSLNLCYLELYDLLLSGQKIKECKYCRIDFESSKGNELRCSDCKLNTSIYRKLYYEKHIEREHLTSRERAKKNRKRERSERRNDYGVDS